MIMVIGRPMTSSDVQPNIRSAAVFQEVMRPVRSLLTIASSDDATIAASRAANSTGSDDIERLLCLSPRRTQTGTAELAAPPPHIRVSMSDDHLKSGAEDPDLRRIMKWVFAALILTVAVAILVVEATLRWFGER
jgi:hypothetical protein